MAVIRSRRVRDAGMGGLVQQPAALGAHRQHPAGRSRGTLLRHAGTTCHGGVTQTKWPPTNPGRFTVEASAFPPGPIIEVAGEAVMLTTRELIPSQERIEFPDVRLEPLRVRRALVLPYDLS